MGLVGICFWSIFAAVACAILFVPGPRRTFEYVRRWASDIWDGLKAVWRWCWCALEGCVLPQHAYCGRCRPSSVVVEPVRAEIVPADEPPIGVEVGPTDPAWLSIVGIPFEVWINSARRCHGPRGFEFGSEPLSYLLHRRDDLGDFREPVDLVKRHRRVDPFADALRHAKQQMIEAQLQLPASWGRAVSVPIAPRVQTMCDGCCRRDADPKIHTMDRFGHTFTSYRYDCALRRHSDVKSVKELYEAIYQGTVDNPNAEVRTRIGLRPYEDDQKERLAAKARSACASCGKTGAHEEVRINDPDDGEYLGSIWMCEACAAKSREMSKPCEHARMISATGSSNNHCAKCGEWMPPDQTEHRTFAMDGWDHGVACPCRDCGDIRSMLP